MAKFIDYHAKMPEEMTPEIVQQMTEWIKSGQADEFGVKPINVLVGTGGQFYCLTHAPDAEAVRKSHAAAGGPPPDEVVEVESLV